MARNNIYFLHCRKWCDSLPTLDVFLSTLKYREKVDKIIFSRLDNLDKHGNKMEYSKLSTGYVVFYIGLDLWCLKPLPTIFQLYRGSQF